MVLSLPVSCGISSFIRVCNWRLVTAILAVKSCTLCKVAGMAGSVSMTFKDATDGIQLGQHLLYLRHHGGNFSIIPLFSTPGIVSPIWYFSRGLLASSRFIFTPPSISAASSAVLPLGMRSSGSTSISATTLPGWYSRSTSRGQYPRGSRRQRPGWILSAH